MKKTFLIVFLILIHLTSIGQEFNFKKVQASNAKALANQMQALAASYPLKELSGLDLIKVQIVSGKYDDAIATIEKEIKDKPKTEQIYINLYHQYAKAKLTPNFPVAFKELYKSYVTKADDFQVLNLDDTLIARDGTDYFISDFERTYENITAETISNETAQNLIHKYFLKKVYESTRDLFFQAIQQDHKRRYIINDSIIVPIKDGAEVSVVVVERKETIKAKKPAILIASIYAGTNETGAMLSASKGYVGVIANTRGKRLSRGEIKPLEYENMDVYEVIDWISKQPWSNQKVGMYGGSYNGFTQWASMKHKVHPALKTIVPMVAIAPGIDYPMENNVLHNYSYSWNFYVTNNKFLDFKASQDFNRWNTLKNTWYTSGVAFNRLDSLDGQVNRLWNAYMQHPSYDDYWKKMIPYKQEFFKNQHSNFDHNRLL